MRQRQAFEHGGAVGVFGALGFEEFAPCGGVEKQIGHFYGGAEWVGSSTDIAEFAVLRTDFAGMAGIGAAAGEGEAGNGSDTGQSFAAKAHAANFFQVGEAGDFAGGVA